jgi:hypothetical protein
MKNLVHVFYAIILILSVVDTTNAQNKSADRKAAKIAEITKLLSAQNYVFKANFANPSRGGSRSLTSDYDLTVSKDTIVAYLPYFGGAYMADYNSTDGGIKFTATNFTYKVTAGKKGNHEIFITLPKSSLSDPKAVQSMRLDVSPDGYASLQVTSFNRDPISFNGTIEERRHSKG